MVNPLGRIDLIRVSNIKITPCEKFCFKESKDKGLSDTVKTELKRLIVKKLRINEDRLIGFDIYKQSIDARKKEDVKVVFSIDVNLKEESLFIKKNKDKDVVYIDSESLKKGGIDKVDCISGNNIKGLANYKKTIVIGAGPAGLMCAIRLAEAGAKPILLERGEDVDNRMKTVGEFWQGKKLNPSSNVQFGEGGAGTFSDGKLNTMVKDKEGYMKEVYRIFVENGADESILYINKPHIGTDKLTEIVKSIRNRIIELGGEVRFSSQVTDIKLFKPNNDNNLNTVKVIKNNSSEMISQEYIVKGVVLSDGTEIECDNLVLALGHSARDTFEMLAEKGVHMEQKPFAMGVRVQHPRAFIDKQQYGEFAKYLPAADYKLTLTREGKRSVYSFCMCPGGYVVNASSEEGRLAVNGMSYSDRSSKSSNSAIVVQVSPEDYSGDDPLAGMRLQRELEQNAYNSNNGKIPIQSLEEFAKTSYVKKSGSKCSQDIGNNKLTESDTESFVNGICTSELYFDANEPDCKGLCEPGNLTEFLPEYITDSLLEAFPEFGKNIKGYNSKNTLLLGLESRTSSPVKICRGENLQSVNVSGLYPCGEGAGYAGGITSAAMDGLKVADAILKETKDD